MDGNTAAGPSHSQSVPPTLTPTATTATNSPAPSSSPSHNTTPSASTSALSTFTTVAPLLSIPEDEDEPQDGGPYVQMHIESGSAPGPHHGPRLSYVTRPVLNEEEFAS